MTATLLYFSTYKGQRLCEMNGDDYDTATPDVSHFWARHANANNSHVYNQNFRNVLKRP